LQKCIHERSYVKGLATLFKVSFSQHTALNAAFYNDSEDIGGFRKKEDIE